MSREMGDGATTIRALALLVLSVLCPAAHGTFNEREGGVCRSSAPSRLLAFQPTLPTGLSCNAGRRRGVLALSSGLRKWLGFGRDDKREQWKQAVTETNGPGLTDEEKLEAARVRRRALVVQDPTYRAKLQRQGTQNVEDFEASRGSRLYSTEQLPRAAALPQSFAPPQPSPETQAEDDARRLRQLELQRDAARTLGKNAASFSAGAKAIANNRAASNSAATASNNAESLKPAINEGSTTVSRIGRRPDHMQQIAPEPGKTLPSADEHFFSQSAASSVASPDEASLEVAEQTKVSPSSKETRLAEEARMAVPPPTPAPQPATPVTPSPTVNYREGWQEAANRNLFEMLNKSRKRRELSSTIARPDNADSAGPSGALGGPAAKQRTSEESPSSDSEENIYDDDARLDALPILEQYSAAPTSSRSQVVEVEDEEEGELPELEVVGGEVVGMKKRQTTLTSPDMWKVIAPKGLIVHAGPGDDFKALGRLMGMQIVEVDAEQGVWLKLAQPIGGQEGWVRKEEGRGKRGGGLARKDAALMVKQGKKLGFDSKEMSKWRVMER